MLWCYKTSRKRALQELVASFKTSVSNHITINIRFSLIFSDVIYCAMIILRTLTSSTPEAEHAIELAQTSLKSKLPIQGECHLPRKKNQTIRGACFGHCVFLEFLQTVRYYFFAFIEKRQIPSFDIPLHQITKSFSVGCFFPPTTFRLHKFTKIGWWIK